MATVNPFKAVRATRDKVALVSSRPYDAYSPAELGAQLEFNPFSFLHIISSSYTSQKDISIEDKFAKIKSNYTNFKEKHTYIKEEIPVYYIYKKITSEHSFIGIIAATSTVDYKNNIIKKHEKTLKKREILFKNYLKATGFNAEPVLLTYSDNNLINTILQRYEKQRAEYEFTTENHKTHLLWLISDANDIKIIQQEFYKMDTLYIADGHHRSASSCLLAETMRASNKKHTGNEAYNFCLSYLIAESNLKISAFNRLIKNLNGLSKQEFLNHLNKRFKVVKLKENTYLPTKKHTFSMYLENSVYSLDFKSDNYKFKTSLHHLDSHILYKNILKKILGIQNVRTDKRITYIESRKGQNILKEQVTNGKYKVAFGLYPASVAQLKEIANDGLKMPPKSTYILPKLRSGLLIYEF
ncbi:MAG: DUF1015 domain-containing protein [Flavobacteriaceae bacterium]|nr:DUF1015 domain-containing protein [Flavobacteriaceae bacterium]